MAVKKDQGGASAQDVEVVEKLRDQLEFAEARAQLLEAQARQAEAQLRRRKAVLELEKVNSSAEK